MIVSPHGTEGSACPRYFFLPRCVSQMEVLAVGGAFPAKLLITQDSQEKQTQLEGMSITMETNVLEKNLFKELAQLCVYQVQNSQDLQDGDPRKMMLQFKFIGHLLAECPFPWRTGSSSWVLVRPSADQLKSTHDMESNLFCGVH